jgi:hypothetical protein
MSITFKSSMAAQASGEHFLCWNHFRDRRPFTFQSLKGSDLLPWNFPGNGNSFRGPFATAARVEFPRAIPCRNRTLATGDHPECDWTTDTVWLRGVCDGQPIARRSSLYLVELGINLLFIPLGLPDNLKRHDRFVRGYEARLPPDVSTARGSWAR